MLKKLIDKATYDKLPDVIKAEYKAGDVDGEFVLDSDDTELLAKIKQFRDNNVKYKRDMEKLTTDMEKFKDIDPAKYAEAMEAYNKISQLEEAEALKKGDLDGVFKKRSAAMEESHGKAIKAKDGELTTERTRRQALENRLSEYEIDQALTTALSAKGFRLRPAAQDDFITRGRKTFTLDADGKKIPKDAKGEVWYGKNGDPITPDEWVEKLVETADHLFEPSQGGGAKGGDRGKPATSKTIRATDDKAFGNNLEAIAKGTVTVTNE